MQKVIFTIALFLTVGLSYSFASPATSNDEISIAFSRSFKHAQIISTDRYKTYTRLTFKMNDMIMFAYYSENGELLAITRNILSTQLPMALLVSLRTSYSDYWISELFEISGESQNCYYVTLENADSKITLRSVADRWDVFSTTQKQ